MLAPRRGSHPRGRREVLRSRPHGLASMARAAPRGDRGSELAPHPKHPPQRCSGVMERDPDAVLHPFPSADGPAPLSPEELEHVLFTDGWFEVETDLLGQGLDLIDLERILMEQL